MVSHLASKTRSPGTCKVAYWTVGHFASKTRSPGTCKVAYWMVGHFASKTRSPDMARPDAHSGVRHRTTHFYFTFTSLLHHFDFILTSL